MEKDHSLIIYEDEDVIVCHKKAGLAVQHKSSGVMDLESMLRNHLALSHPSGGRTPAPYLAVIHRLDQPVEGVLVFAKNRKAAAFLNARMQAGEMGKEYLAVVQGEGWEPGPEKWRLISDYLLRDGKSNRSEIVPPGTPGAKEARLFCRLLKRNVRTGEEEGSLLQIRLDTGRHHQIRVQLAGAGMPIIGDRKYGPDSGNQGKACLRSGQPIRTGPDSGNQGKDAGSRTPLCLAAWRLKFPHPSDGRRMHFEVIPDFLPDMKDFIKEKSGR